MQLQQLATVIGSGLIQAIKPFVMQMNTALSGLITFAQNVVNALGKIFGWEMEVNTKGFQLDEDAFEDIDSSGIDDIGESADDATKSVKKLKDQLQGFDKLNVLRSTEKNPTKKNKDDSSGSGNGTDQLNNGDVAAALRKTKGAFESEIDNLYDLGRYISDKLSEAMESIDWDKAYEKAKNFGTGLAEFLNGLISKRTFENLGNTIAKAIMTAIVGAKAFSDKFDWSNLGDAINAGIKKYLDGFDWKTIKEAANSWAAGLADLLNKALTPDLFDKLGEHLAELLNSAFEFLNTFGENFDFENFGKSLGAGLNSFLSKLDWKKYFTTAQNWGKGIANALNAFVDETDFYLVGESISKAIKTAVLFFLSLGSTIDWKDLGVAIADTINGAIENFPAKEFADTLDAWVQGIFDGLVAALTHIHWNSFGDKIVEFISNIDLKTIEIVLSAIALKKGASFTVKVAAGILASAKEKLLLEITNALKNGIGLKELVVNLKNIAWMLPGTPVFDVGATALLEKLWDTIYNGMPKTFQSWYTKFDTFIKETVIGGFMNMMENAFKQAFNTELWDKGAEHFKQGGIHIIQGLAEGLGAVAQYLTNPLQNIFNHIWNTLCTLFGISSPAEKMKPIGKYIIEGILEGFKLPDFESAFQWVANKFSGLQNKLSEKMSEIKKAIGEKWDEIKTSIGEKIDSIKSSIGTKWDEIKSTIKGKWDDIKSGIGSKLGEIKKTISGAWDSIKSTAKDKLDGLKDAVSDKFKGLKKDIPGILSELKKSLSSKWKEIKDSAKELVGGKNGVMEAVKSKFQEGIDKIPPLFGKNGLYKSIKDTFSGMSKNLGILGKNAVSSIYEGICKKIESLFPFTMPKGWIKFPKMTIKMHEYMLPGGQKIKFPVGVEFYRKAYDNPMMFTNPTAIPGNLKVFGDGPGGEMVYGHDNLMKDIRDASGGSEITDIGNRQIALLQQQNQLLRGILEKEFGISGDDLFRGIQRQAANYSRRTGRPAFE